MVLANVRSWLKREGYMFWILWTKTMNAQSLELPVTNDQSMMIKSILLKKMMIKTRLSTIIEDSWTSIYKY